MRTGEARGARGTGGARARTRRAMAAELHAHSRPRQSCVWGSSGHTRTADGGPSHMGGLRTWAPWQRGARRGSRAAQMFPAPWPAQRGGARKRERSRDCVPALGPLRTGDSWVPPANSPASTAPGRSHVKLGIPQRGHSSKAGSRHSGVSTKTRYCEQAFGTGHGGGMSHRRGRARLVCGTEHGPNPAPGSRAHGPGAGGRLRQGWRTEGEGRGEPFWGKCPRNWS